MFWPVINKKEREKIIKAVEESPPVLAAETVIIHEDGPLTYFVNTKTFRMLKYIDGKRL
jgi:hypothetical protein